MVVLGLIAGNTGSPVAHGEDGQVEPTKTGTITPTRTPTPKQGELDRPETEKTPVKSGDDGKGKEGQPCGPNNTFKYYTPEDRSGSGNIQNSGTREAECRPFEVRAIKPDSGFSGETHKVEILGKGFKESMTFSASLIDFRSGVVISGTTKLTALTGVEFVNPSKLKAVVPMIEPGKYSLLLTATGNNSDILRDAYTSFGDGPVIDEVRPRGGSNDRPTRLFIEGFNFKKGLTVTLSMSNTTVPITTELNIERRSIRGVVPAGLTPGVYDVVVTNPDGKSGSAPRSFVVFPPPADDLFVDDDDIFSRPRSAQPGDTIELGVRVHRRAGTGELLNVPVQFNLGDPATGTPISTTVIPKIAPWGSESAVIKFSTAALTGTFLVSVIVDPSNTITEFTKLNNTATRRIRLNNAGDGDKTAPVITSFTMNNGLFETTSPTVSVSLVATDTQSPVNSMLIVERMVDAGFRGLSKVQSTGWITYSPSFSYTLFPAGGTHLLYAWVSDNAGNISQAARRRIDLMTVTDTVRQGQVDLYTRELRVGDKMTATLTTISGDADLYVFGPNGRLLAFSLEPGTAPDTVVLVVQQAGMYRIEVEGFLSSDYSISIGVSAGAQVNSLAAGEPATSTNSGGKPVRSESIAIGTDDPLPDDIGVANDTRAASVFAIYLPQNLVDYQAGW